LFVLVSCVKKLSGNYIALSDVHVNEKSLVVLNCDETYTVKAYQPDYDF